MDYIVVSGIGAYDGRYELDLTQELTTREWGWIKRFAGYLPGALTDDAFTDPELACVLAVIAIRRAGRIEPREAPGLFERLADAPFGAAIQIETEPDPEGEVDADSPPPSSLNGSDSFSGPGSRTSSDLSTPTPPASGTPASAISESRPVTPSVT